MDVDRFWDLIEQARQRIEASKGSDGREPLDDCEALAEVLEQLEPDEIVQFDHRYSERMLAAYNWDLWAALAVIEGAYGDDSFEHFRAELILLGREAFEAALQDADSLADQKQLPWGMEGLIYVPAKVYEEKAGQEFPYDAGSEVPPFPAKPAGELWEEADLPSRLPRLWAIFHDEDTTQDAVPEPLTSGGPRVRIIEGPFKSHEGIVVSQEAATGQVIVLIDVFGRARKIDLKTTQIGLLTRTATEREVNPSRDFEAGYPGPEPPHDSG